MPASEPRLNFAYLPATPQDREEMLKEIGVRTFEELLSHIPDNVRAKPLALENGLSELELTRKVKQLSAKNKPISEQISFLGGGSYRRFVPAAVSAIVSRSEFATAYTPYQPEVSQGSLQAIYEFQTAICLLTGMEVANASMYDGPTALAEAAYMAVRLSNKKAIVLSPLVNPEYKMVCKTYADSCDLPYIELKNTLCGGAAGATSVEEIKALKGQDIACVAVQYTNYFGVIEDLEALSKACKEIGALLLVVTDPISLGVLKAPGDLGADIVVGDAQSCGNFLSFGGPSAGYMACRNDYIRQLPGRLAGVTTDNRGQRAFTLTLQTREQHIRRAKATSNICTNQALNALAMLVYLSCMGPKGLSELCEISVTRAHYLQEKLCQIDGVSAVFNKPFFNEFLVKIENSESVLNKLQERGILAGIAVSKFYSEQELKDCVLIAVTEMNEQSELDAFADTLAKAMKESVAARQKVLTV
ncbi:MAG: aminomethyl-transferring glycine dehydrogenase subunit GcvPA [Candidatus Melainabacteria bacterium]|nr:aminomethyl-transferring glycine dehydrogenase subunit GcvPA [Candidatus Melainabacteria bacterium]